MQLGRRKSPALGVVPEQEALEVLLNQYNGYFAESLATAECNLEVALSRILLRLSISNLLGPTIATTWKQSFNTVYCGSRSSYQGELYVSNLYRYPSNTQYETQIASINTPRAIYTQNDHHYFS